MNDHLKYEGRIDRETVAGHLETLAAGLRAGTLLLESGDTSMNVDVEDEMVLNIEAKAKPEGKNKIEVEMSWRSAPHEEQALIPGLTVLAGDDLDAERARRSALIDYGDAFDSNERSIRRRDRTDVGDHRDAALPSRRTRASRGAGTRSARQSRVRETAVLDNPSAPVRRAVRARKKR